MNIFFESCRFRGSRALSVCLTMIAACLLLMTPYASAQQEQPSVSAAPMAALSVNLVGIGLGDGVTGGPSVMGTSISGWRFQ